MRPYIAVAAHKQARFCQDDAYHGVQAGAALHAPLGILRDDAGENISHRNDTFCELTVLYWLWKNVPGDALGLCHYRRYFGCWGLKSKVDRILTGAQAEKLLERAEVIVPLPRVYLIETNESHFVHAHGPGPMNALRQVMRQLHPAMLPAFERVMKRRWGRRFNMCIMTRERLDDYCAWLFPVLFAVENKIGPQSRMMGYLAERLLDVWLEDRRPKTRQLPVIHLESQHWPRKICLFVQRKLTKNMK